MDTGFMRSVDRLEQRGAARWRDRYPERETHSEHVAELYGIARTWKRITLCMYVVALVLLLLPDGHVLRFVGDLFWSVGLLPLLSWQISRMLFRKAAKNDVKP
jgi:hypothetical protein